MELYNHEDLLATRWMNLGGAIAAAKMNERMSEERDKSIFMLGCKERGAAQGRRQHNGKLGYVYIYIGSKLNLCDAVAGAKDAQKTAAYKLDMHLGRGVSSRGDGYFSCS